MRRGAPASLLLLILLGLLIPPAGADTRSELEDVRREIESLSAQIDRNKAETRRVGEQLAAAQERLAAVESELAAAQAEVDRIRTAISTEEAKRDELVVRLARVEAELADTRGRLREAQDDLDLQAVSLYIDASASTGGTLLLSFQSASDLAVGLAYAGGLASDSEDLIDTFEFLKREEERQRELVETRKAEVEALLAQLEAERGVLEAEAARVEALRAQAAQELAGVRSLLAGLNADIAAAEQHKEGLEADAKRLERELAKRQTRGGTKPGILAWPVAGRLSSPYGYRIHPIFGTKRLHTGIDIGAASGSPIGAAGAGVVILAGPYGGYGNTVVVDHGGGLATLYAHQSRIAVSEGQAVATGDIVGYIGCTGLCTGPHLHFETREGGTPVNPMKYLGG